MGSLQEFIIGITLFISNVIIPLLFGLALLFFIWNVFRFFILGNKNEPDQENAKKLAIYGIAAFVFLVSLWGIINLLIGGLGLTSNNYVTPDYLWMDSNHQGSGSSIESGSAIPGRQR